MTTHFTLRDFFAYLLNGIVLSFCVSIIFVREIFIVSIDFFNKYEFVNNFSFLLTVFCIPILYVLGHIVGTFSYWLFVFYNWIQKKTLPNWIQKITKGLLYKQRI